MARTTLAALLPRLRRLLANDATFLDDELEEVLDANAISVVETLTPEAPRYLRHRSRLANYEDGAQVLYALTTVLALGTDYTIDLRRGIVTTPVADYRALRLEGTAYDLNAAAADGWERIAARFVGQFDFKTGTKDFKRSQQYDHAMRQATRFRALAWARTTTVERSDTPAHGDGVGDALVAAFRQSGR